MTNKEIEKLLDILDKKSLDEVRTYLNKEKEKNSENIRMSAFETYITNKGIKAGSRSSTYYGRKNDNEFIFTNGISIYYVNEKFYSSVSNLLYKIVKSQENKILAWVHRSYSMPLEKINKLEKSLQRYKTNFIEAQYKENIDKNYTLLQNFDERFDTSIEHHFQRREIELSQKLLGESKLFIDERNPLAYTETDLGRCYILGIKNSKY